MPFHLDVDKEGMHIGNYKNEPRTYQLQKKKARDTLNDAKTMFNKVTLFTTVNRIYYAIFYEVLALLLTKDLSSSKHS